MPSPGRGKLPAGFGVSENVCEDLDLTVTVPMDAGHVKNEEMRYFMKQWQMWTHPVPSEFGSVIRDGNNVCGGDEFCNQDFWTSKSARFSPKREIAVRELSTAESDFRRRDC